MQAQRDWKGDESAENRSDCQDEHHEQYLPAKRKANAPTAQTIQRAEACRAPCAAPKVRRAKRRARHSLAARNLSTGPGSGLLTRTEITKGQFSNTNSFILSARHGMYTHRVQPRDSPCSGALRLSRQDGRRARVLPVCVRDGLPGLRAASTCAADVLYERQPCALAFAFSSVTHLRRPSSPYPCR